MLNKSVDHNSSHLILARLTLNFTITKAYAEQPMLNNMVEDGYIDSSTRKEQENKLLMSLNQSRSRRDEA